jgi:hypothetical protein
MALVTHMRGVKLLIKVEDVNSPSAYSTYCSINAERGISFSAQTNDFVIPDCADPDLMAWLTREKISLSGDISGAGILNTPDTEAFFDWVTSSDTRNVRVYLDGVSAANGGGYWSGAYHCTEFALTGGQGTKVECTITLASDGEVDWTDAV